MLPASRDTNGNWGIPVDGVQLSVRFHRCEFARGEPVVVIIMERNLDTQRRDWGSKEWPHTNFRYDLRRGTNEFTWTWQKPTPLLGGLPHPFPPNRGHGGYIEGHHQRATFLRLEQFLDLSQLGEYSLQVTRAVSLRNGSGGTNVVSGWATFRIVEQLSPEEVAATNAFAKRLQTMQEEVRAAEHKTRQKRPQ